MIYGHIYIYIIISLPVSGYISCRLRIYVARSGSLLRTWPYIVLGVIYTQYTIDWLTDWLSGIDWRGFSRTGRVPFHSIASTWEWLMPGPAILRFHTSVALSRHNGSTLRIWIGQVLEVCIHTYRPLKRPSFWLCCLYTRAAQRYSAGLPPDTHVSSSTFSHFDAPANDPTTWTWYRC